MAPNAKKPKHSPIQKLKIGETMTELSLTIVESGPVRTTKAKTKVWNIICTDGVEFILITMWEKNLLRLERQLGTDFLASSFTFTDFAVKSVDPDYNWGSVDFELRATENSSISACNTLPAVAENAYYNFLAKKQLLDTDEFEPKLSHKVRPGELWAEVQGIISVMSPLNIVPVRRGLSEMTRVFEVTLQEDKTRFKIVAWGIQAAFLHHLLSDKLGSLMQIGGVALKETDKDEVLFLFDQHSKCNLQEREMPEIVPATLKELAQYTGTINCNIRLLATRNSCIFSAAKKLDGTMCCDKEHKAQLIYNSQIKLLRGTEFSLTSASVEINASGVMTLTAMAVSSLTIHAEKMFGDVDPSMMEYPEKAKSDSDDGSDLDLTLDSDSKEDSASEDEEVEKKKKKRNKIESDDSS